jgi:hypothetical protein
MPEAAEQDEPTEQVMAARKAFEQEFERFALFRGGHDSEIYSGKVAFKLEPVRNPQDTFYTTDGHALRPQTSTVQVHAMQRRGAVFLRNRVLTDL